MTKHWTTTKETKKIYLTSNTAIPETLDLKIIEKSIDNSPTDNAILANHEYILSNHESI